MGEPAVQRAVGTVRSGCLDCGDSGNPPLHDAAEVHRGGANRRSGEGMSVVEKETSTLLDEPHHDGSDLYVLERPVALGGEAVVRARVPRAVDTVAVRWVEDGEARGVAAERQEDGWWLARFPVRNPRTRYRWLLSGGEVGYAWLNGTGVVAHDIPDADDFVLDLDTGG